MASKCPNKNTPEWQALSAEFGNEIAFVLYKRAGENIPSLSTAQAMVKNLGLKYSPLSKDELKKLNVLNSEGKIKSVPYDRAIKWAQQIRDKYPNYKVEVSVSPNNSRLNSLLVQKYSLSNPMYQTNGISNSTNKKLDNIIKQWFSKAGITYNPTNVILDHNGNPIDAIAKADLATRIVDVVEGLADESTLSEEAAHFLVDLLEDQTIVNRMMNVARSTETYKSVQEAYQEVYDDETSIAKEAVGKLIAQEVIKEFDENSDRYIKENPSTSKSINNLWDRLKHWLKNLFKRSNLTSNQINTDMQPFRDAARIILSNSIEEVNTLRDTNNYYYQLSDSDRQEYSRLKESFDSLRVLRDPNSPSGYVRADGTEVPMRVSDLTKRYYERIFRDPLKEASPRSMLLAKKGTLLHKYEEHIMRALVERRVPRKSEIMNLVIDELNLDPDFSSESRGFFALNDTQFTDLTDGIKVIYNQILRNQEEINRQNGTHGEVSFYFEMPITHDNIAGTIDLMVLYSNGAVGLYDYKNINFKSFGGEVVTSRVAFYKETAYDIQLTQYKNILHQGYGVTNFAESRIVPINMQLSRARRNPMTGEVIGEEIGFGKIEIGDGDNSNKEYLDQLPVSEELTNDEGTNKILEKLYNRLRILRSRYLKDHSNNDLKASIIRTEDLVHNIILRRDYAYAYNEVEGLLEDFRKREAKLAEDPNALNIEYLNDLKKSLDVFDLYSANAAEALKRANNDEITDVVNKIPAKVAELRKAVSEKIVDLLLRSPDGTNIDITKPGKSVTGPLSYFKTLREYDHPAFVKLANLVLWAQTETLTKYDSLFKEVESRDEELASWAKNNNMSKADAYLKLYNKDTGRLFSKYSPKFYADLDIARGTENVAFMLENFHIKRERRGVLKYTGEAAEIFEKALKRKKDALENQFPGDNYSKLRDRELKNWRRKYDIATGKEALFNPSNYFLRKNLEALDVTYISPEFEYIKQHKPLVDYYDMYVRYNQEFADITGRRIDNNFVANVKADLIEKLAYGGFGDLSSIKADMLGSFELRDDTAGYITKEEANNTDVDGKPIFHVPLLYTSNLRSPLSKSERQEVIDAMPKNIPENSLEYNSLLKKNIAAAEYKKGQANKSFELSRNLALLAKSVYNYEYMTQIEGYAQALLSEVRDRNVFTRVDKQDKKLLNQFTGQALKRLGLDDSEIAALESFINLYIYGKSTQSAPKTLKWGQKLDEEGNVINPGREISRAKLLKGLITYSSAAQLGLKPIIVAANYIQNNSNALYNATEGQFFTISEYTSSKKEAYSNPQKYYAAMDYFLTYGGSIYYDRANSLTASKAAKTLSTDTLFAWMRKTDESTDRSVLVATMMHYGIDQNGRVVPKNRIPEGQDNRSLYDRFTVDDEGNMSLEGLSKPEYTRFRAIVQKAATRSKGMVPVDDRMRINTTELGVTLLQYRSWLPSLIKARFGGLRYDAVTDTIDMGRYVVGWQDIAGFGKTQAMNMITLAASSIPIIGHYIGKNLKTNTPKAKQLYNQFIAENPDSGVTFDEFVNQRIGKLKAIATELQMITGLLLLAMLAKALIPDDKEGNPVQTFLSNNVFRLTNIAFLEASFFLNIKSTEEILQSPFALIGFASNAYNVLSNTLDETRDLVVGDDYKGFLFWEQDDNDKTPAFFYTSKMLPGVNAIQDFFDVWDRFSPVLGQRR